MGLKENMSYTGKNVLALSLLGAFCLFSSSLHLVFYFKTFEIIRT